MIAGEFRRTIDLGGGTHRASILEDVFAGRFASDGSHLFSHFLARDGLDYATDVEVDREGNLLVSGRFTSIGVFLVKLTP